jgi:hypothetical protein
MLRRCGKPEGRNPPKNERIAKTISVDSHMIVNHHFDEQSEMFEHLKRKSAVRAT